MSYCYIINKIVPFPEAVIPIQDLGFLRGYAIFDFFRTVNKKTLFFEHHLERIMNSSKELIMFDYVKTINFENIINNLINKININDIAFKIIITGGSSTDGFIPTTPNLYILPVTISLPTPTDYKNGLTYHLKEHLREVPNVKTTNYLQAIKTIFSQKQNFFFQDVLYYYDNYISEASRANFYIVKNGKLITTDKFILFGVTRKILLQIASKMDILEIRPISKDEVFEADECFVSSTTKRLMPITKIDNQIIGNGTIGTLTRQLLDEFLLIENKYIVDKSK